MCIYEDESVFVVCNVVANRKQNEFKVKTMQYMTKSNDLYKCNAHLTNLTMAPHQTEPETRMQIVVKRLKPFPIYQRVALSGAWVFIIIIFSVDFV